MRLGELRIDSQRLLEVVDGITRAGAGLRFLRTEAEQVKIVSADVGGHRRSRRVRGLAPCGGCDRCDHGGRDVLLHGKYVGHRAVKGLGTHRPARVTVDHRCRYSELLPGPAYRTFQNRGRAETPGDGPSVEGLAFE